MDLLIFIIIFLLGFITMFIGAITGGVGLVTRPILLFLGFPAPTVIGTSKVSGQVGESPSLYLLAKSRRLDWKLILFLIIPVICGSLLAAIATISLFKASLELILGIIIIFAAFFMIFKKDFGIKERRQPLSHALTKVVGFFGTLFISFIGTIGGGLGPVYSAFYVWLYGKDFIEVSAIWRIAANLGSIIGVIIFIIAGVVDWVLFAALGSGFFLGSYFGTRFHLKKGNLWIKYLIFIIAVASAIKLIFF